MSLSYQQDSDPAGWLDAKVRASVVVDLRPTSPRNGRAVASVLKQRAEALRQLRRLGHHDLAERIERMRA